MIESEHTRSVSRDVLAHTGVPHHAAHACHARASHGFFGEGANYVAGLMPHGSFHEDERPCSHVPPACPSWLHRLWRQVRTHTFVASSTILAPQEERRRARTRCPCAIDG